MATFASKVWEDMIAEYPTRYKLINPDLSEVIVTIVNMFGQIIQSGDVWDAATMNNLESRIAAAFGTCVESLTGTTAPTSSEGKDGDTYYQTETENNVTSVVAVFIKINGEWLSVSTGGASLPQAEGGGF